MPVEWNGRLTLRSRKKNYNEGNGQVRNIMWGRASDIIPHNSLEHKVRDRKGTFRLARFCYYSFTIKDLLVKAPG